MTFRDQTEVYKIYEKSESNTSKENRTEEANDERYTFDQTTYTSQVTTSNPFESKEATKSEKMTTLCKGKGSETFIPTFCSTEFTIIKRY